MSQLASDNFDRSDNADLGANWTPVTSEDACKIVSNKVQPTSNANDASEYYNAVTWPADQYSQITAALPTATVGAGSGVGVLVRASNSARTYYRFVVNNPGDGTHATWELGRMVAGTFGSISTSTVDLTGNDAVIYLEVQGTTLIGKIDGVTVTTQTDSNIASGRAGIAHSSQTDAATTIDDWVGGDFATNTTMAADAGSYALTGADAALQQIAPLTWLRVAR